MHTPVKPLITEKQIKQLNEKYKALDLKSRIKEVYSDFKADEVMLTSSFAATSAFLLKLFSEVHPNQLVYFIDTGYHFKETLNYKKQLTETYGLQVKSVRAVAAEHEFTSNDKTWKKNPDYCCHINKVKPLEKIKSNYRVWVSGLMQWQSDYRASLDIFEQRKDILKFYPLLDVSKEERDEFIKKHQLPFHPLVKKGYFSIGCKHCTVPGKDRSGRWNNNPKTECGLHL